MFNFIKGANGFNYSFEKKLKAGEVAIVKMPAVSSNKRGINDIGWQTDGNNVNLYGTLARIPSAKDTLWQKIEPYNDVNKTVTALKVENSGDSECSIVIRAILC